MFLLPNQQLLSSEEDRVKRFGAIPEQFGGQKSPMGSSGKN